MDKEAIVRRELAQNAFKQAEAFWPSEELGRVREALDAWSGQKEFSAHPMQRAAGFFIPSLKNEPWLDLSQFAFMGLLHDAYPAIRDEVMQFMDGRVQAPPYGLADDAPPDAMPKQGNPAGWSEWRLYRTGEFCEARCAPFPNTRKLIERILDSEAFMMNAVFLILEPGACLAPHYDRNNIFVNVWLPLVAPEECYLTVAGKTFRPAPGVPLGFNHSYLHEAGNKGDSRRVVLSLSVFHPELTPVEREVIKLLGAPQ